MLSWGCIRRALRPLVLKYWLNQRSNGDLVCSMRAPKESLFLCPQCRRPLPDRPPCKCGFVLRESNGVIDLMTEDEFATVQPFVEMYEQVRREEAWGCEDLDLPFISQRNRDIWEILIRTLGYVGGGVGSEVES